MPLACGHFNNLDADVWVVSITEDPCSGAVGGDVPGVERGNGGDFSSFHSKAFERKGPNGEDQVPRGPEKGFMYDELLIAVLIKTFHLSRVSPDAVHAGSRITGEFNQLFIGRVKLRVDNCPRPAEEDFLPQPASVNECDAGLATLFEGGHDPLPAAA